MKLVYVDIPEVNYIVSLGPTVNGTKTLPGNVQAEVWGVAIHPLSEVLDLELTGGGFAGFPIGRLCEGTPIRFRDPIAFGSGVNVRPVFGGAGRCVLQLAETKEERDLLSEYKRRTNARVARLRCSERLIGSASADEMRACSISLPEGCNQLTIHGRDMPGSYWNPATVTSINAFAFLDKGPALPLTVEAVFGGFDPLPDVTGVVLASPASPGTASTWTVTIPDLPLAARTFFLHFIVNSLGGAPNATVRDFGLLLQARRL